MGSDSVLQDSGDDNNMAFWKITLVWNTMLSLFHFVAFLDRRNGTTHSDTLRLFQ